MLKNPILYLLPCITLSLTFHGINRDIVHTLIRHKQTRVESQHEPSDTILIHSVKVCVCESKKERGGGVSVMPLSIVSCKSIVPYKAEGGVGLWVAT